MFSSILKRTFRPKAHPTLFKRFSNETNSIVHQLKAVQNKLEPLRETIDKLEMKESISPLEKLKLRKFNETLQQLQKNEEIWINAIEIDLLNKKILFSQMQASAKESTEFPGKESLVLKKRRSEPLVSTIGADFLFSDRGSSFEILAASVEQRFYCLKLGLKDKGLHKLPFLADGPGSGKSRFLQELPKSFVSYIKNLKQSLYDKSKYEVSPDAVVSLMKNTPTSFDDFKNSLSDALYINVSFGNGSMYMEREIELGIDVSLCLRILYPYFADRYSNFNSFFDAYLNKQISLPNLTLSNIFRKINKENQCIVLGIDEVNVVHTVSKIQFGALFRLVGSFSCIYSPLFVPVLAGTVIGPMKSVLSDSMYPPLHIPLPLLSFDSCLRILASKDTKYENQVETNPNLRQVVSDMGGHCRALEILFGALSKYSYESYPYFWDDIISHVRHTLSNLYPMSLLPLFGDVIAYSFLSLPVSRLQEISTSGPPSNFLNMEECGLVKLLELPDKMFQVKIPYIFVLCFLSSSRTNEYSKFWYRLLISKKMYWQEWEHFNCYYMAFRLSLFSKLRITSTPLTTFLSGAKINYPEDIIIKIPSMNDIKTININYQYPSTNQTEPNIGTCVLNGPGAAFDAFVYLETSTGKLLIAQQMKLASTDSKSPQKITNKSIDEEYKKVNDSISQYIPDTDFILLVLGHCEGVYDEKTLPNKCAIVAKNEFEGFYGEVYRRYFN